MRISAVCTLAAAALLSLPTFVSAQVQITPVVTGLSSPLFVGHSGDGLNRLFIVERGGVIKVVQPGSSTPTVFLNITSKIVAGGERGLLGLAFHPLYASNRRFFVFYTRVSDGDLVIAEYAASPTNRDVADLTEEVLLTIEHSSQSNHNGGMLAFGPDGYLYIGVGDGGSGNDPPNNAQNKNNLLGKILRIDVNPSKGSYVVPMSNPFFGSIDGADEIFVYGLRNPWRFSFDRGTGQAWLGDVGQGAREEIDSPIVSGGNYGWRLYEGTLCNTNITGNPCNPSGFLFPVDEDAHGGGRCSVTGGYVYRGVLGTLPAGTYVYGDYCSGEVFTWNGTRSVLLLSGMNISSFGEDEAGEIYVVNLTGGTVGRLSSTACSYAIDPVSRSINANSATGTVAVTAGNGCGWTALPNAPWLHVTSGSPGNGSGTVGYSVDANTSASARTGTLAIADKTFTVNQSGAAPCTYSINPTNATFGPGGGTGSVALTAPLGCLWQAVANETWITVTSATSGSGSATITYSVAPYAGKPRFRNGSLSIAGQTLSIRQSR